MLSHRIARTFASGCGCGRRGPAVMAVLAGLVVITGVATAQTNQPTGGWERDRLRQTIEERYRVVPLQNGVALVPRREQRDVRSIEIAGDTVAIDGTVVTGAELRERLKDDSEAVLALSYLRPAERKALFQPQTAPRPPDTPAAPRADTPPAGTGEPEREVTPEPETTRYRGRHNDARIHIGGSVRVGENETVDGPVVAVGGPVLVDGEVLEDVVAIGGSVHLGPKARVRGDVTSVGGTIDRDPKAEVGGRLNEVSFAFPHFRVRPGFWLPARGWMGPGVEGMATAFRMLLFGLLAVIVFVIARRPVERIERVAASEPWKAGLVGLLTELLFIPVFVLTIVVLAVSIVGIPLLLFVPPLTLVALLIALVLGFTGVAYRVGGWAADRFGWQHHEPLPVLLVGLLGIWVVTIVGRALSVAGGPVWAVASALLVVGFVVEYLAWTVGLGAAVMTRLGRRPGLVVPPPPMPPAPAAPAAPPSAPPAG